MNIPNDIVFYLGTISGLFFVVYSAKRYLIKSKYLSIWFTGGTIFVYRFFTYLTIWLFGNTDWWRQIYSDKWNHYYIGALLIFTGFVFVKNKFYKQSLVGIGAGMVIDEISDILKTLPGVNLPYKRDSLEDLLVIISVFCLYLLCYELSVRRKIAQK